MNEQPTSSSQAVPSELTVLHEAITATLKEALPQIKLVEAYPVLKEGMALPALLYAMTNVAPGLNPGDGRLCVSATFEAIILLESKRAMAPLQAAILASKLLQLVNEQYWDVDFVDQPSDMQAMPAEVLPELHRCVGWTVQWRQNIYLGDTAWPWPDEPPGSLVFAFDPDSGPGNEGQYVAPEALG